MNVFANITQGDTTKDTNACVRAPWRVMVNCKSREEGEMLHAHRYLRNRGGVPRGEVHTFTVYTYTDKMPCHASGNPMTVHACVMVCDRRSA